MPPCLRVVDMSACVNGWNNFVDCSLPVDSDATVADGAFELNLFARAFDLFDFKPDFPLLGELDRVVDEVGENLPEPERIAEQDFRQAGRNSRARDSRRLFSCAFCAVEMW